MREYTVVLARSAERDLHWLSSSDQARVTRAIERLANNPRPPGVKKLAGAEGLWRLRAGDYRIVYSVDDHRAVVDISHIRHRREVYR